MLRRSLVALAGIALLALVAATGWALQGASPARALTNCDTTEAAISPAEQQMLTLINGARAAAGVQPLKLSAALNRAAAWKSADPSATGANGVKFDHTDSLGRSPIQRAQDCGYAPGAGENIAFGFGGNDLAGAAATFAAWMNSPGHKANILLPNYKVIGIGAHGSAWTTDFGFVDDSGAIDPPPPVATPTARSGSNPGTGSNPGSGAEPGSNSGSGHTSGGGAPSPSSVARADGLTPRFRASIPDVTHQ